MSILSTDQKTNIDFFMWNVSNVVYDSNDKIIQIKIPDSPKGSTVSNYLWYESDDYNDYRSEEMLYIECAADASEYSLEYVIKMKRLNLNMVKITAVLNLLRSLLSSSGMVGK